MIKLWFLRFLEKRGKVKNKNHIMAIFQKKNPHKWVSFKIP